MCSFEVKVLHRHSCRHSCDADTNMFVQSRFGWWRKSVAVVVTD